MSKLHFSLDEGFRATPRPIDLSSHTAKSLYGGPWLEETRAKPQSASFALWAVLALFLIALGALIDQAPVWLLP